MNLVLHINGWPGSGKRTIGAIVADRRRATVIDRGTVYLSPKRLPQALRGLRYAAAPQGVQEIDSHASGDVPDDPYGTDTRAIARLAGAAVTAIM